MVGNSSLTCREAIELLRAGVFIAAKLGEWWPELRSSGSTSACSRLGPRLCAPSCSRKGGSMPEGLVGRVADDQGGEKEGRIVQCEGGAPCRNA